MMQLITPEIRATLPHLYAQENEEDPTIHCRFYSEDGRFEWLLTESDGDTCFGWIKGDERQEFGYFSLHYLENRVPEMFSQIDQEVHIFGKRIAEVLRDETFEPILLSIYLHGQRVIEADLKE